MSTWNSLVIVAMLTGCYHETSVGALVTNLAIRGERLEVSDCDLVYDVGFNAWYGKMTHELGTSSCRTTTLALPSGIHPLSPPGGQL